MKFKSVVTLEKNRTLMVLEGWLDERAELPELDDPVKGDLVLDLQGITLVNSLGVRNWIQWLKVLRVESDVKLINCSPAVVKQVNILQGFLSDRTKIESIYVPYFCEDCGREDNLLINIPKLGEPVTVAAAPPEFKCSQCGMNMELDMIESQYFTFLQNHKSKFS